MQLNSNQKVLKIGVAGPFSGPRAAYGELIKKAVKEANDSSFNIIFGDDKADPQHAKIVALNFVNQGVDIVIGHFNSECARTAGQIYKDIGITFLMPAATAPDLCEITGGYRLCPPDTYQINTIVTWLNYKKIFINDIWTDGSTYGNRLKTIFNKLYQAKFTLASNVIILFGSHHAVANEIQLRAIQQTHKLFIVSDDCDIEEFYSLIQGCNAKIIVPKASPSYFNNVIMAFDLIKLCKKENSTLSSFFSNSLVFNKKQFIDSKFILHNLTCT